MIKLRRQFGMRKKLAEELGFAVECWVVATVQETKERVVRDAAQALRKHRRKIAKLVTG